MMDSLEKELHRISAIGFHTNYPAAARSVEESAMALLKKQGATLPLDVAKVRKIVVIGDIAKAKFAHGGNSAAIKTRYEVTPLEGIQNFVGKGVQVVCAQGYLPAPEDPSKAKPGDDDRPELVDEGWRRRRTPMPSSFLRGEQKTMTIPLTAASFSYYDPKQSAWVAAAGDFEVDVGTSSRDLPLHGTYTLQETIVAKDGR